MAKAIEEELMSYFIGNVRIRCPIMHQLCTARIVCTERPCSLTSPVYLFLFTHLIIQFPHIDGITFFFFFLPVACFPFAVFLPRFDLRPVALYMANGRVVTARTWSFKNALGLGNIDFFIFRDDYCPSKC